MQYINQQEEARGRWRSSLSFRPSFGDNNNNQLLLCCDVAVYYEGLQDKLTQARDAHAALDALREEHRERVRREAEEAERQRQMQMAQKLEIMRKKKQEYLQYQRQIAMQRMQVGCIGDQRKGSVSFRMKHVQLL